MIFRGWIFFGAVCATYLLAVALLAGDAFLFDDATSLQYNTALVSLGDASTWRDAFLSGVATPFGRVVSMASFALQAGVEGGLDPAHLRVINALLHVVTAVLLSLCAGHLLSGLGYDKERGHVIALGTGVLWLLFPLHLSTVLYPVQRMTQLAALFSAAGYLSYLRWRGPVTHTVLHWPAAIHTLLWVALFTLLGALSKEVALLLPWLIAWTELAVFRGMVDGRRHWLARVALVASVLPLVLLVWGTLAGWGVVHDGYRYLDFAPAERLLTQLRILWLYVGWLLIPFKEAGFVHDDLLVSTDLLQPATTAIAALAWTALIAFAVAMRRRVPALLFAVGFFLIAHAMESSVLALELAFEHRNYLPSFAVALLLATALASLLERLRRGMPDLARVLPYLLLVLLVIPLGQRLYAWSDSLTMALTSVAAHPQSPRAHYLLGQAREQAAARATGDERVAQLLAARKAYLDMASIDTDAIAPLVILHRFDARHFPGNPQQHQWLTTLPERLDGAPLPATQYNAVAALLDCLGDRCAGDADETRRVLRALETRYRGDLRVQAALYRYHLYRGSEGDAQRVLRIIEASPSEGLIARLELEQAMAAQDNGAMLEAVVPLYRNDGLRRQRWFGAVLGAQD